jgi:hypothetical protein
LASYLLLNLVAAFGSPIHVMVAHCLSSMPSNAY